METKNFYLNEDFEFEVGCHTTKITVPRLTFKNTEPVFKLISAIVAEDSKHALKIVQEATKVQTVLETKAFESFSKAVGAIMPKLIKEKCYDKIIELVELLSEGIITKDVIEAEAMQYNEVCQILSYLIEENFNSLKNLSASLQAMRMSVKSEID